VPCKEGKAKAADYTFLITHFERIAIPMGAFLPNNLAKVEKNE
jgi:hypothetical protein